MNYSNAIELNQIEIRYGKDIVLKDINFILAEGEFVAIFGENGAGKTTLFRGILQLIPINKGSIKVLGKDITKLRDKSWLRTQIGYVPQGHNTSKFPISVFDATLLGRWGTSFKYMKKPSKEDKEMTLEVLSLVDLKELKDTDCRNLSGGQRQRLNIARALVREPKILLLDEPNTHLDKESIERLEKTIIKIRESFKISILMISHDHNRSYQISDRSILIKNGQSYSYEEDDSWKY